MGKKKALIALGHLILRIAYHILLTKKPYKELGTEHLAELKPFLIFIGIRWHTVY